MPRLGHKQCDKCSRSMRVNDTNFSKVGIYYRKTCRRCLEQKVNQPGDEKKLHTRSVKTQTSESDISPQIVNDGDDEDPSTYPFTLPQDQIPMIIFD